MLKYIIVLFNPFTREIVIFINGKKQEKRQIEMESWEYYDWTEKETIAIQLDTDEATTLSLNIDNVDTGIHTICSWSSDGNHYEKDDEIGIIISSNSMIEFKENIIKAEKKFSKFDFNIYNINGIEPFSEEARKEYPKLKDNEYNTYYQLTKAYLLIKLEETNKEKSTAENVKFAKKHAKKILKMVTKHTMNGHLYVKEIVDTYVTMTIIK